MQTIVATTRVLMTVISYFLLYVDDMLVSRLSIYEINNLKIRLFKEFKMKDLGVAK